MKIRKFLIFAISAALIAIPSCKKDEKDDITYKNSLKGSVEFNLPTFVAPGDVYTLVPSGVTRPEEGKGIGYIWDCPEMGIRKDTTRTEQDPLTEKGDITFIVKDTLGTVAMKCIAFAEGYYTASKSQDFVIIHPNRSLVYDPVPETEIMVDARDGEQYPYKKIGNTTWMLKNLAFKGAGISYWECKAVDAVYGRYYNWEEAQTVCPEGWRLPGKADWDDLFSSLAQHKEKPLAGIAGSMMVNAYINNDKVWEFWPEVKITNASGFSALPVGYVQYVGKNPKFVGNVEYATYWSAEELASDKDQAIYNYIYMKNPNVMVGAAHKKSMASAVRCVKE